MTFLRALVLLAVALFTISAGIAPCLSTEPWPQANGPRGNFSTLTSDMKLIDDLSKARMVWASEDDDLGFAKGSVSGFFRHLARQEGHPGSCSGPILTDGKLFVATFRPAGEVWAENQPNVERYITNDKKPLTEDEVAKLHSNLRIDGDDLLVAIDAATGKTAWKAVEGGQGLNRYMGKRQGYCVSPTYFDGKVFSLGTTGLLYAYNAKTGERLWQSDIGQAYQDALDHKEKCFAEKKLPGGMGWDVSLVVADGVLIVPTYVGGADIGLRGVNIETGKTIWEIEKITSRHATPAPWRHGEREYLLTATVSGTLNMIEPKTGKVLWNVEGLGENHFSLTPTREHVFVNIGSTFPRKEGDSRMYGRLAGYAISPAGAKRVWEHPNKKEFLLPTWMDSNARRRLAIADDAVYFMASGIEKREGRRILKLDESTGEILAETPSPSSAPHFYVVEDRLLVIPDASHGDSITLALFETDGLKQLADFWKPPHIGTTAYEVYMEHPYHAGRIYLRTQNGRIRCYDFSK